MYSLHKTTKLSHFIEQDYIIFCNNKLNLRKWSMSVGTNIYSQLVIICQVYLDTKTRKYHWNARLEQVLFHDVFMTRFHIDFFLKSGYQFSKSKESRSLLLNRPLSFRGVMFEKRPLLEEALSGNLALCIPHGLINSMRFALF